MNYKVPFVHLPTMYHRMEKELNAAFKDVMSRGDLILRKDLSEFEHSMASLLGMKYTVGVGSGTDALFLALKAANVGTGDEVITVAYTCIATIAVITNCGAKPVLVDIGDDYNMNVDLVDKAITSKTKAIIPVHLNGRMCNMKRLMDIARKHKLIVIEDAAQAIEARFDEKKAGTFGLAGCFSLYPMKIFGATGDGGLVVTNDDKIAEKISQLRDLGQRRFPEEVLYFGFSSRLDNLQAALLNVKLKYLQEWITRRRELGARYHKGLFGVEELKLPPPPQTNSPYFDVFQNYVIRAKERDKLVSYLKDNGIETLTSWYLSKPLHKQKALNLAHFHLPNTEQFAKDSISLPLNSEVSDEQVDYVIKNIKNFYKVGENK